MIPARGASARPQGPGGRLSMALRVSVARAADARLVNARSSLDWFSQTHSIANSGVRSSSKAFAVRSQNRRAVVSSSTGGASPLSSASFELIWSRTRDEARRGCCVAGGAGARLCLYSGHDFTVFPLMLCLVPGWGGCGDVNSTLRAKQGRADSETV